MKKLSKDLSLFIKCKVYVIAVSIIALCSYGFAVTHYSIGMDDTAVSIYFDDGLAPYVGRWCFFVLNRIFRIRIAEFAPWTVELISVLILMLSVTLWCVLWKRLCGTRVTLPQWSWFLVAGIFLSCPLISEVFVFYLHNGICTGYGLTALALLCFSDSLSVTADRRGRVKSITFAVLLLTVAMGFYESFAIVFIMGAVMAFALLRMLFGRRGEDCPYRCGLLPWLRNGIFTGAAALILRSLILALLKAAFRLERMEVHDVSYHHLFGDIFQVEGELIMILKRFWMLYYVNGLVYLPITVLVISLCLLGIWSLYHGIRKKDILLPLCAAAVVLLPVMLCIVEGLPTRYRTGQYVPMACAFAVLLLLIEIRLRRTPKPLCAVGVFILSVLIWNQCADMNKWFYLDYLKYRDAVEVMDRIACDLEASHDISKPIIFRGAYRVPYSITKDAYCSFSSPQYQWICRITDPVDPHLKEKYFAENGQGYIFAEMPIASTLQWGITAFGGFSGQLIEFWNMHGHSSFRCEKNLNVIAEAERIRNETGMPGYPLNGYILECENYIIVNLESAP